MSVKELKRKENLKYTTITINKLPPKKLIKQYIVMVRRTSKRLLGDTQTPISLLSYYETRIKLTCYLIEHSVKSG